MIRTPPFLVVLLLFVARYVLAYQISGSNYCVGQYALCAGSPCTAIPGNTSYAHCSCELHNGLNNAGSSCEERSTTLTSTYSILNLYPSSSQPLLYTFSCEGANAGTYANCADAKCITSVNSTTCTCPLHSGANHYLGPECPTSASQTKALCASLRSSGNSLHAPGTGTKTSSAKSSSTAAGSSDEQIQAAFYGPQPTHGVCNAPGASG